MREPGAADRDRFIVGAGAAALFGELRKSNRRRVRLDPASKFEQSWIVVGHALILRRNREAHFASTSCRSSPWFRTAHDERSGRAV